MITRLLLLLLLGVFSSALIAQEATTPHEPTEQPSSSPQENDTTLEHNDVDSLDFDDDLEDEDLDDFFEMKGNK